MKALLDTHVFLWWVAGDARISQRASQIIADGANGLFLSAASGWEMAIKVALGKLILPSSLESFVSEQLVANSIQVLPVQMSHVLHVSELPPHHHDPFDRLIISQAQLERLPILTADPLIARYPVDVIW